MKQQKHKKYVEKTAVSYYTDSMAMKNRLAAERTGKSYDENGGNREVGL